MKHLIQSILSPKLSALWAGAVVLLSLSSSWAASGDDRCFELRTYYANPGKLEALHARFRDHTVALFEKHGMSNVGYWVPVDNEENKLVYLMAYPSREARERMWKAFFADPEWTAAYRASVAEGKLVNKVENVFMSATDYSPLVEVKPSGVERLFELRVYTTHPGKLKDINARFRDHTIALFKKHGMTNIGYWNLDQDQKGAGTTLVYLLAHRDKAARDEAFGAFGKDPAWKAARDASEAKGKILIPKGVQATQLKPTDYSPLK